MTLPDLPPFLSNLRGRVRADVRLAERCWFRVGGPAEWLFTPEDANDLALFLKQVPKDVPVTVIGVGSNLLVRDGGIAGVVVRLGRGFANIRRPERSEGPQAMARHDLTMWRSEDNSQEGSGCGLRSFGRPSPFASLRVRTLPQNDEHYIYAGAAVLDLNVAIFAREEGLAGLEFLSGIPGTIGGALAMNAGAYGLEIKDVLVEAEALDEEGNLRRLSPADMGFSYRHCGVPEGWIFTSALLRAAPGDKAAIARRMETIENERQFSQPVKSRTGGSTFKNPPGRKAWELIDRAGCRGLTRGGAQVSEKHCNFLINTGEAMAADLEALGEDVRERVKKTTGVELEWEIKRVGIP